MLEGLSGMTGFMMPFDVSGQPAVSLPLAWSPGNLPIGVQLVAPYGREDVLFRLGSQLESQLPWADRHPDLSWAV
jgi:amidase